MLIARCYEYSVPYLPVFPLYDEYISESCKASPPLSRRGRTQWVSSGLVQTVGCYWIVIRMDITGEFGHKPQHKDLITPACRTEKSMKRADGAGDHI